MDFLKLMSKHFEIIVWTASSAAYAKAILDYVDPSYDLIDYRLSRQNCIKIFDHWYMKDLRILANRRIEDIIMVDNSAFSYINQLENAIPVMPFYNNKNDCELRYLAEFLIRIAQVPDVRPVLSQIFQLHQHEKVQNSAEWYKLYTAQNPSLDPSSV
jgi:CTD small phosphatase-like protein 2